MISSGFDCKTDPEPARSTLPVHSPTSGQRTSHDDDFDHHGTEVAEPVAEGTRTKEGSWQTVRCQHMRKKKNKITGTLMPGNGSLI